MEIYSPLIMENQMEKKLETGRYRGYKGVYGLFAKIWAPLWLQILLRHLIFRGTGSNFVSYPHLKIGLKVQGLAFKAFRV